MSISLLMSPFPCLKIVDIGAMHIGEGAALHAALLKSVPCEIIGFDPTDQFPLSGLARILV